MIGLQPPVKVHRSLPLNSHRQKVAPIELRGFFQDQAGVVAAEAE